MSNLSSNLLNITAVQAQRLALKEYEAAFKRREFNPYPAGESSVGPNDQRAVMSDDKNSGSFVLKLDRIGHFDGALPDYLQHLLFQRLHDGDRSYQDFLNVFDQRLGRLDVETNRAKILVSNLDHQVGPKNNIFSHFAQLTCQQSETVEDLIMLLPLLSGSRSLEQLKSMSSWIANNSVVVRTQFSQMSAIDKNSLSQLSARRKPNSSLGCGLLLGRLGIVNNGSIHIDISCSSMGELTKLQNNTSFEKRMRRMIQLFLREATKVNVWATISRRELPALAISTQTNNAVRLGPYGCLSSSNKSAERTHIKLFSLG